MDPIEKEIRHNSLKARDDINKLIMDLFVDQCNFEYYGLLATGQIQLEDYPSGVELSLFMNTNDSLQEHLRALYDEWAAFSAAEAKLADLRKDPADGAPGDAEPCDES